MHPYFQYFTGEEFFRHELPHERSGMSHWGKRIGDRLDMLLQESLRLAHDTAHDTGALKKSDPGRVTVDTAVQPKNIAFPTDANMRVARRAAMMAGRYAHAKQYKRMNRQIKVPRTRLGRVIRDIARKIDGDAGLRKVFAIPLGRARQIPPPEAAPARPETLFLARARNRAHRQGQGAQTL